MDWSLLVAGSIAVLGGAAMTVFRRPAERVVSAVRPKRQSHADRTPMWGSTPLLVIGYGWLIIGAVFLFMGATGIG